MEAAPIRRRLASRVRLVAGCVCAAAAISASAARAAPPLVLSADSSFYVGGAYADSVDGKVMHGSMYVHAMIPAKRLHLYPIVMVHGINATGTVFEGTPDGREGWAQYFVRAGYAVYVVDQPTRGRSPYYPDIDGPNTKSSVLGAQAMVENYTAPELYDRYPHSHLHNQWPGNGANVGRPGDPVFDAFMASVVKSIPTQTGTPERLTKQAGAALLDRIGPSILITHSQGGALGWQIADARPGLVKAILAIEPAVTPSFPRQGSTIANYGVTVTPITYRPPVDDPAELRLTVQDAPDGPGRARCYLQPEPARALPNLKGVRIGIVVAGASQHVENDYCVSRYLAQAGVPNELIELARFGIRGNAHMMMLEKNSDRIAARLDAWLRGHGL